MASSSYLDSLCRKIVAPTRHRFNEFDLIQRKLKGKKSLYQLFKIQSTYGYTLSTIVFSRDFLYLPTVLYLHGNGGNKLEALQLAHYEINLIAFDFGGCGNSQGQFITYGERQAKDIGTVIQFIKSHYNAPKLQLTLWGRSMGASIALMYASSAPKSICTLILDSPFRTLTQIMRNYSNQKIYIPDLLFNFFLSLMQKRIQQICGTNIFQFDYLQHLNLICQIPIVFGYSPNDYVVRADNVKQLYDHYHGFKLLYQFQSMHHEDRQKKFLDFCYQFITEKSQRQPPFIYQTHKGILLSTRRNMRRIPY